MTKRCTKAECPCWPRQKQVVGIEAPGVAGPISMKVEDIGSDLHIPFMQLEVGFRVAVYKYKSCRYVFSHIQEAP